MIKKNNLISMLLIIALSTIIYANSFKNEFVWDDHFYIEERAAQLNYKNIPHFLKTDVEGVYRPIREIFYIFSYSLYGQNPLWYHLNGLVLHIINSILIYFILINILKNFKISLMASLLFAAHPIHTEAITFITTNFDVLGITFYLASFFFYLKSFKDDKLKNKTFYLLSLFFALLAFFTFELTLTLVLIIILYEFVFNKNALKKIKNYAPYLIIAVFYLIIRFFVIGIVGRLETDSGNYFFRLLTIFKVLAKYIYLLIFPINLSTQHDIPIIKSVTEPIFLFSLLFILFLFVIVFIFFRKNKIILFSFIFFFYSLLPVSNIIPIQRLIAESYLYLPSLGFVLLISYLLYRLSNVKKMKVFVIAVFIIILLSYLFLAIQRNKVWKDDLNLWQKTIETSPSSKAYNNLAIVYEKKRMHDEAIEGYKKSIEIAPRANAYFNLGLLYSKLNKIDDAEYYYKKSLLLGEDAETHNNLGILYSKKGLLKESGEEFQNAIMLNPSYLDAYANLGTLYEKQNKYDLALQEYRKALNINPDIAIIHYNLGVLYSKIGMSEKAEEEFYKASKLDPQFIKR